MNNAEQVRAKAAAARLRLKSDFKFYAKNCLIIRTKDSGLQPFVLNDAQQYIDEKLNEQLSKTGKIRAIILKGRQQGASTYTEGRFLWKTTHSKGAQTFILTHDAESTNALFKMTSRYYENLPSFVRPIASKSNAKELHFENLDSGYKIGTAGNKGVGRGTTLQFFHGSEVAFWPNASEHTKGILQAVPDAPGTEVILESTANGVGNYFHQQWKEAESGNSEFIAIFVPWFWQQEYRKPVDDSFKPTDEEQRLQEYYGLDNEQLNWRRIKIAELSADGVNGVKAFKQEYPNNSAEAFQMSGGDGLITSDAVLKARNNKVNGTGPLIVGVDPSRGGDRFSTAKRHGRKLYDTKSHKVERYALGDGVAICKKLLDTVDLEAGKRPDFMFVDAGFGADLVDRLHELGYMNVKAIYFGSSPLDPYRYKNKRSEMWGEMRNWLNDENLPVQVTDSDSLQADLIASQYKTTSNDQIQLLSKDDIKKLLGYSPDEGDAAALTFAEPVHSATTGVYNGDSYANSDYDLLE